jgi:hypothetical protein
MRDTFHINFFYPLQTSKHTFVTGSFRLLSARLKIVKYKTLNVPVFFMVSCSDGKARSKGI